MNRRPLIPSPRLASSALARISPRARRGLVLAFALLAASGAHAANGTWIGATTPLAWDDTANWAGGVVADGADFTADFSAADISGYTVVEFTTPRTIGNLVFGDSALATPGSWSLGANSDVLTLTGAAPTITVPDLGVGQSVSISAAIAGSGGLTKTGAGTLISYGNKTYSGPTLINAGALVTTSTLPGGSSPETGTLTIAAGATLEYRAIYSEIAIRPATISGAGTILKTGTFQLTFAGAQGASSNPGGSGLLALGAGSLIDIREGTFRLGNWNSQANLMTGNLAAVAVAAGARFDIDSTNAIIGSLSGAGTVSGGYYGPRTLTVGTDNTDSTFSGVLTTNAYTASSSPSLFKTGTGDLTLTGSANIRASSGNRVLSVTGGTAADPSTLNLHFTAPSALGYIIPGENGGNAMFAPESADNVVVDHSAGTLAVSRFEIGDKGVATYTARGTAQIDAFDFNLAFTGPSNGAGAVTLNIADSAQVRIFSNRHLVMGQYYGRPVTVNQTGGFLGLYSNIATTLGGTGSLAFKSANTAATYNLAGGTLSIPAITRDASGGGAGGGNGVLNFNGGTLQITSASFTIPDGEANGLPLVTVNVREGGATIDPYGLAIAFNVPLRHAGAAALDGGLVVAGTNGGGTLTLSAANTYTGDTVVNAGSSLVLASTGQLAIKLGANGVGTDLRGAGSATLDGTFVIDRSAADLTNGNTWQLVANSTLAETYGATFALAGFTESADVWTLVDGDYTWTFSEATGALVLQAPASSTPYETWASANGLSGPAAEPTADPDSDGSNNLLEFALDGDPLLAEGSLTHAQALGIGGVNHLTLTVAVRTGADFDGSTAQVSDPIDGVTYTIEGSTDLTAAWNASVVEATGSEVTALQASLPTPSAGWTYRTFRPATALSATSRVFLRARVE